MLRAAVTMSTWPPSAVGSAVPAAVRAAAGRHVPRVREHRARAHVEHERRAVGHPALAPRLRVPGHDVVQPLLQAAIEGGADPRARGFAPLGAHEQVRRIVGKRERLLRQRLRLRQALRVRVDHPAAGELVEQAVPPLEEGVPVPARVHEPRAVGQHRERRALRPREGVGVPAEPAPRRRLEAHHVAAERRVRGEQAQDPRLGRRQAEAQRQHRLHELLADDARPLPARETDDLHGDGARAAHHLAAAARSTRGRGPRRAGPRPGAGRTAGPRGSRAPARTSRAARGRRGTATGRRPRSRRRAGARRGRAAPWSTARRRAGTAGRTRSRPRARASAGRRGGSGAGRRAGHPAVPRVGRRILRSKRLLPRLVQPLAGHPGVDRRVVHRLDAHRRQVEPAVVGHGGLEGEHALLPRAQAEVRVDPVVAEVLVVPVPAGFRPPPSPRPPRRTPGCSPAPSSPAAAARA